MPVRDAVRRIAPYRLSAERADVKLNQNEAQDDLPEPLKREALRRLAKIPFHRYPELHPVRLQERLGVLHDWPAEGVVVAGGSNVLIQTLVIACALGRTVLTVKPTFAVYRLEAELLGAELIEHPLGPDFTLPQDALAKSLGAGGGIVFLTDPAAPTGNRHDPDAMRTLLDSARGDWTAVVDEAYADFDGRGHLDTVRAADDRVALRTFSKALGLGGVRLGYALTSPALATELRKVALPFSVSALQVAIAETVLDHLDVVRERVASTVAERARVVGELERFQRLHVYRSSTNFVLIRHADAAALFAALLERGVLIRRQDHLPGLEGCLRISIGSPSDNDRLLAAMEEALATESVHEGENAHVRTV